MGIWKNESAAGLIYLSSVGHKNTNHGFILILASFIYENDEW